jgi:PAS domain S-box-containing protein
MFSIEYRNMIQNGVNTTIMNSVVDNIDESFADGVFAIDKTFKIISFSQSAERITGYSLDEVIGKNCLNVLEGDLCTEKSPLKHVLKTGEPLTNLKIPIKNRKGETITIIVHATPLKNIKAEIIGVIVTFRDIEETYKLHSKLYTDNARLNAILQSITDGVLTVDMTWRITSFNPAAEKITGYKAHEIIGEYCHEVFHSDKCKEDCPLIQTVQTNIPVYDRELNITAADGRTIPISVNTALLIDETNTVIGGVETFRDLSTYKHLREELDQRYSFGNIIGKDKKMRDIYTLMQVISLTDSTVLIMGETGTGKELVARAIHHNSKRKHEAFIKVDCTALPETLLESELFGYKKGAFTDAKTDKPGKFALADQGTIFLDEIGDLPSSVQSKLLRVLEEHAFEPLGAIHTVNVDVRVIAATNRDLRSALQEGQFREDLYYRLNVVPITIPPLRERPEDIPLLIDHFIELYGKKIGKIAVQVSQEAMDVLVDYAWPGNVRQLENAIEHAFIHCKGRLITREHLPEDLKENPTIMVDRVFDQGDPMIKFEQEVIIEALRRSDWNKKKAAQILNISYVTLWRKMKKFGIKR